MSDFQELLNEQLKDPEFRRWWEAREAAMPDADDVVNEIVESHRATE